jgi:hypothetical protein
MRPFNPFVLSVACRASFPIQEDAMLPDVTTFLRFERFQFNGDDYQPGVNWALIVALALNFGIWIGLGAAAWSFFHG